MTTKIERKFFSGSSVEQAVLAAASHYGLDPGRVAYRLRDKKHGFLNIRRNVVIEVDPGAPERTGGDPPEAPAVEKASPRRPVSSAPDGRRSSRSHGDRQQDSSHGDRRQQDSSHGGRQQDSSHGGRQQDSWRGQKASWEADEREDPVIAAVERVADDLGDLLALDVEAAVEAEEEGVGIELSGPDSEALVRDEGRVLEAIEHLLPRMVRGLIGRGIPCHVDSQGFRAAHERRVKHLAEEVASDVRRELQERRLDPMSPADRRLVHMALAEDPTVITESVGEGFFKRVKVVPASEAARGLSRE